MEPYHERIHVYERLSHLADEALRHALYAQHVKVTAMEHRIKTETSLAGKLELKGGKYQRNHGDRSRDPLDTSDHGPVPVIPEQAQKLSFE